MEFEREIRFDAAFDKRHDDPKKNYGIHGVNLTFFLKKGDRAVQFVVFTDWQLPGVKGFGSPMPADLGYHSPEPTYEGQEPMSGKCGVIGCECFYDGSTLNAEPVFEILLREGSEGVWKELERYYISTFGDK